MGDLDWKVRLGELVTRVRRDVKPTTEIRVCYCIVYNKIMFLLLNKGVKNINENMILLQNYIFFLLIFCSHYSITKIRFYYSIQYNKNTILLYNSTPESYLCENNTKIHPIE